MNIICYSLFILLAWSTPCFSEPLAQIEQKLTLLINGGKQANSKATTTNSTSLTSNKTSDNLPPAQPPSSVLRFDFGNSINTHENLVHAFSVQVGSSRNENLCYRVASSLRKIGYPAFNSSIELSSRGIWHRVYIGAFSTRDAAQKVKEQLLSQNIVEGFIRYLPYAVQIGSSGNYEELQSLHQSLLTTLHLPYSTPIRNASSGLVEARLLIGACYVKENCGLLLSKVVKEGFSAVVVER